MDQQHNGTAGEPAEAGDGEPVDLRTKIRYQLEDGTSRDFEVVGVVEDDEQNGYAVAYSEEHDEFIVTDEMGNVLEDEELAQEILDDFRTFNEESAPEQS